MLRRVPLRVGLKGPVDVKRAVAAVAGCALLLAGCSGGDGAATSKGCQSLTAADIQQVAAGVTVKRTDLDPGPALHLECSTVFAGPSGELVVAITEARGGAATFARVKTDRTSNPVTPTVKTVKGLGDEAFLVNSRFLAIRSGERVVTLETGYTVDGVPVLTVPQLNALAKIVLAAEPG